jgi:hypothetical protein
MVLERPREPRAALGPREAFDLDAARRALDAPRVVAKVKLHAGHVEVPPTTVASAVVARACLAAFRAARSSPRRRDIDDQPRNVEAHIDDTSLFQSQQDPE